MKWLIYGAVLCGSFLLFLYWTFPHEQLKERLIAMVQAQLGDEFQLRIASLDSHWVTGLELSDIELQHRVGDRMEPWLQADRATLRVGPMTLLFGQPRATFTVTVADGEIDGAVRKADDVVTMSAQFNALALDAIPMLQTVTGLRLRGAVDGTIQLESNLHQIKSARGTVSMTLDDWNILKESQLKLGGLGAVDLDEAFVLTEGKDSAIEIEINRGTMQVSALRLTGGDIELDLSGQIFFEQRFQNSRMNIKGGVAFSEKLKSLVPVAMFGPASPDTGRYPVELVGRVSHLRRKIGTFTF
ncbi:MAG: type II secretion system protein GspN [Deltaproteobacteria bacterium]|nr:type II secretion system protein GspN [Deltaproteobacteria bacterium]